MSKDTLVVIWTGAEQRVETGRVMLLLAACGNLNIVQQVVDLAQGRELDEVRRRLGGLDLRPEPGDFTSLEARALQLQVEEYQQLLVEAQPALPVFPTRYAECGPNEPVKLSKGDKARRRKLRGW